VSSSVEHCSLDSRFYIWFVSLSAGIIILLSALGVFFIYNPVDSFSPSSPRFKTLNPIKIWLCKTGLLSFCNWVDNKPVVLSNEDYFSINTGERELSAPIEEAEYNNTLQALNCNNLGYSYSIWRERSTSYFRLDFVNEKGFYELECTDLEHSMLSFCVLKVSKGIPVTGSNLSHILPFKSMIDLIVNKKGFLERQRSRPNHYFYGENISGFTELVMEKFTKFDEKDIKRLVIHNVLFFRRFDYELLLKGIFCLIKKPDTCGNSEWKIYLSDIHNHILNGKCVFKKKIKCHMESKSLIGVEGREDEAEALTQGAEGNKWIKVRTMSMAECDAERDKEKLIKESKTGATEKQRVEETRQSNRPERPKKTASTAPVAGKEDIEEDRVCSKVVTNVEVNLVEADGLVFMKSKEGKFLADSVKSKGDIITASEEKIMEAMESCECFPRDYSLNFKSDCSDSDSDDEVPDYSPDQLINKSIVCENEFCILGKKCPKYRTYKLVNDKLKEIREKQPEMDLNRLKIGYCNNILTKKLKKKAILKELSKTSLPSLKEVGRIGKLEGLGPVCESSAFNRSGLKKFVRGKLVIGLGKGKGHKKKAEEVTALKGSAKEDKDREKKEKARHVKELESFLVKSINNIGKVKNLSLYSKKPRISRNKMSKLSFGVKAKELMLHVLEQKDSELHKVVGGAKGNGFSVNKKVLADERGLKYSFKDIGLKRSQRTKMIKKAQKGMKEDERSMDLEGIQMKRGKDISTSSERSLLNRDSMRRMRCINGLEITFLDLQRVSGLTKTFAKVTVGQMVEKLNEVIDRINQEIDEIMVQRAMIKDRADNLC
jgi:hypothetical protein